MMISLLVLVLLDLCLFVSVSLSLSLFLALSLFVSRSHFVSHLSVSLSSSRSALKFSLTRARAPNGCDDSTLVHHRTDSDAV